MFPVLRRSSSRRGPRLRVALAICFTIAALMGAGLTQPVAAEPVTVPVTDQTPANFESECNKAEGQLIEITNDSGAILSSSCTRISGHVDECDWVAGTCTYGLIKPPSNPLQENRPGGGLGGVIVDETITPVDDNSVSPGGAEDPTGDGQAVIASQVAADQVAACEAFGGIGTIIEQRTTPPIDIRCTGGTLDGMICYGTICDYFASAAGPEEDAQGPATGGIVFVQLEDLADAASGVTPGEAEDPTGTDTVVIAGPSGSSMHDNAMMQLGLCRLAGGMEAVYEERTTGSGVTEIIIICHGGLLDKMGCISTPGFSSCYWLREVLPQDPRVTPAAGVEVPAENAPAETAVATEAELTPTAESTEPTVSPAEPTATPTEAPAEPTVAPTAAPPPPKNDTSVPPGEVADPTEGEPTPTVHVLT